MLLRIIAENSPVACTSSLEVVLAISHSYDIISKLFPHHVQIQRGGGQGVLTLPEESQKYRVSYQYWSGPPEKSQSYQASIQCWAIIDPPAKRHLMAFRLRADDGLLLFGSPYSSSKKNVVRVGPWTLAKLYGSAHAHFLFLIIVFRFGKDNLAGITAGQYLCNL